MEQRTERKESLIDNTPVLHSGKLQFSVQLYLYNVKVDPKNVQVSRTISILWKPSSPSPFVVERPVSSLQSKFFRFLIEHFCEAGLTPTPQGSPHCIFLSRRGSMLSTAIFVYAATSPVNGYFGGSLYAKQGGNAYGPLASQLRPGVSLTLCIL